ncbi:alpha/beta hydrolase [Lentimicrobium sp. S6]|uniref:alpha/beta hydrolase n=1 Tax=Lentimicrobium sp. S6 TaxID=2735872 RepID=UPI001554B909|nr:alpha/beta hydrolase-fold protein [Lentimicrobium sp. S6]NPD46013.1 esterase [Lentimicrobium sp. S6]
MKKTIIIFLLLTGIIVSNAQTNLPQVSSGKIERIENFKSQYVNDRNIDVWLPEGYSEESKYNVLYMHDGQMLFDANTTWNKQEWGVDECISELISEGKIKPCIVVGIFNDANDRHSDFFPQKPFESLPENFRDSLMGVERYEGHPLFSKAVQSDNYLKFLVEEVKPYIDAHYSVNIEKENTFVAGSSMGGLISMYAICEYPDVFAGAACLSTHWPGIFQMENNPVPNAFQNYMQENLPEASSHLIYFDYGTETLDALYELPQKGMDEVMKAKGYTKENWITLKFEGEEHSENSWKKRLTTPLEFIMGTKNK